MAWQTPKTDWTPSQQGVSNTDFNRIEGNTAFLYTAREFAANKSLVLANGNIGTTVEIGRTVAVLSIGKKIAIHHASYRFGRSGVRLLIEIRNGATNVLLDSANAVGSMVEVADTVAGGPPVLTPGYVYSDGPVNEIDYTNNTAVIIPIDVRLLAIVTDQPTPPDGPMTLNFDCNTAIKFNTEL
jgi:hypothetical protein